MQKFKKVIHKGIIRKFALDHDVKKAMHKRDNDKLKVGFIAEEFFHEDLRGFGGYGMTVKNLTDQFYQANNGIETEVLLTSMLDGHDVGVKHYYNADVIFRPAHVQQYVKNFYKYASLVNTRNIDFLISIDWYKSYEYAANALPKTPLIIWIKDPRGREEWEKIASVPLELKVSGDDYSVEKLDDILNRKKDSIHRILEISKKHNRKVIFGAQAQCLIERAKRSYGLDEIDSIFFPNIVEIPDIKESNFSKKPTLCFLGRLEPVKRPETFCALAERFPEVDFLVAGIAHYPEIMNPTLEKYKQLPNLKFLGMVKGREKHELLNSAWAFVNTSVHEALPVSFLEAFSYGKTVISCQNPDDMVGRFGYPTGEILGEGLKKADLDKFSEAIKKCLAHRDERIKKGLEARKFVIKNYSFDSFQKIIQKDVIKKIRKGK